MNTEDRWLVNLARNQNSLVVEHTKAFAKHWDTPTTINKYPRFQGTSQSPDPFLRVAFGKGSG